MWNWIFCYMKASEHKYTLIQSEYASYWIIPDFYAGRKRRFTVVVNLCSNPIIIGRELPLGHAKKVVKEHIASGKAYSIWLENLSKFTNS